MLRPRIPERSAGLDLQFSAVSITVKLSVEIGAALREEAARQSLTPDELAARVLAEHIPTRRRLGFVAIGESTSGRTAAEAEEMLAEGFGRRRSWSTRACSWQRPIAATQHMKLAELMESHAGPLDHDGARDRRDWLAPGPRARRGC